MDERLNEAGKPKYVVRKRTKLGVSFIFIFCFIQQKCIDTLVTLPCQAF